MGCGPFFDSVLTATPIPAQLTAAVNPPNLDWTISRADFTSSSDVTLRSRYSAITKNLNSLLTNLQF